MDLDGKAGINYGVTGVPETFFIGPDGLIKYKEAGPVTMEIMESKHRLFYNKDTRPLPSQVSLGRIL